MNPRGLGSNTSGHRIERLDERWSVVSWITKPALHCVLRRRPDEGIDLLAAGSSVGAIVIREGRVPAPRYRSAARWKQRVTGRWLAFATLHGNGAGVLALDRDEDEPWTWDDPRLTRAMLSTTTPLVEQWPPRGPPVKCRCIRTSTSSSGIPTSPPSRCGN